MDDAERKARKSAYMRAYATKGTHGPCTVEGCERPSYGRSGLCAMHYQRRRLLGDVGKAQPHALHAPTHERWAAMVRLNGSAITDHPERGPCWLWTGGMFPAGYGCMRVGPTNRGAHVVGYELWIGPVPKGLTLDHLCHTFSDCRSGDSCLHRACVNPLHLEPVTREENIRRGQAFAAVNARKTHCDHGHDLTDPANLVPDPRLGRRICRACVSRRRHERYLRLGK